MVVLVTGGAGFIGSNLCDKLLEQGEEVICVDNFNDYYNPERKRENIKSAQLNPNFKLYEADIRDKNALDHVFKEDIEVVVHLAARAGVRPSIADPQLYEDVNIRGTLNLLEQARINGVNQFIFGSSSSVYGNAKNVPFSEDQDTSKPVSPYAATKKAGETLCHTHHHLYGINVTCLRFFTVYGPRGRPDMAPYLFTDAIYKEQPLIMFGDGSARRDYTYIDDIISGILKSLETSLSFEIINLGNSNTVTLKEFISIIERVVGKDAIIKNAPDQAGDVQITHADITKAREILNWSPTTNVNQGMEMFFRWYARLERV